MQNYQYIHIIARMTMNRKKIILKVFCFRASYNNRYVSMAVVIIRMVTSTKFLDYDSYMMLYITRVLNTQKCLHMYT